MAFPFKGYCPICREQTWHYEGKCKWEYLHMPTTKIDPEREQRLVRAWDFLEHWQKRLSRSDGEQRLEEFYGAAFKFLVREGLSQHSDLGKIEIPGMKTDHIP